MKYTGVVITDDMTMGNYQNYEIGEAAIQSIKVVILSWFVMNIKIR